MTTLKSIKTKLSNVKLNLTNKDWFDKSFDSFKSLIFDLIAQIELYQDKILKGQNFTNREIEKLEKRIKILENKIRTMEIQKK